MEKSESNIQISSNSKAEQPEEFTITPRSYLFRSATDRVEYIWRQRETDVWPIPAQHTN